MSCWFSLRCAETEKVSAGRTLLACFRVKHGCGRLAGIVEQRGEEQLQLGGPMERRPIGEPLRCSADHARMRPHVASGMPLRVLIAGRHLARPRLGFGPSEDLCVGSARNFSPCFGIMRYHVACLKRSLTWASSCGNLQSVVTARKRHARVKPT